MVKLSGGANSYCSKIWYNQRRELAEGIHFEWLEFLRGKLYYEFSLLQLRDSLLQLRNSSGQRTREDPNFKSHNVILQTIVSKPWNSINLTQNIWKGRKFEFQWKIWSVTNSCKKLNQRILSTKKKTSKEFSIKSFNFANFQKNYEKCSLKTTFDHPLGHIF